MRGDSPIFCYIFLLTPLREGRLEWLMGFPLGWTISTHAPAGGATLPSSSSTLVRSVFLLTPLREGRLNLWYYTTQEADFYSRPCGRGDSNFPQVRHEVLRQIAER